MAEKRHPIIWSVDAIDDYQLIVYYLLDNWTVKIADKFIQDVDETLENLSLQPLMGKISSSDGFTRSILVSRYHRLYYEISADSIELLNFFDMRQNPLNNRFENE